MYLNIYLLFIILLLLSFHYISKKIILLKSNCSKIKCNFYAELCNILHATYFSIGINFLST